MTASRTRKAQREPNLRFLSLWKPFLPFRSALAVEYRDEAISLRQQGNLNAPFPVSPSGGKPGRAGSPHAAGTLPASQLRWHASMPRLPPQEGLPPPLCIPPGPSAWMHFTM
jgi:hypothetical protein